MDSIPSKTTLIALVGPGNKGRMRFGGGIRVSGQLDVANQSSLLCRSAALVLSGSKMAVMVNFLLQNASLREIEDRWAAGKGPLAVEFR